MLMYVSVLSIVTRIIKYVYSCISIPVTLIL